MKKLFRQLAKMVRVVCCIFLYMTESICVRVLYRDPVARRKRQIRTIAQSCAWALRILAVQVWVAGKRDESLTGCLFVSNHMSYLDVLALSSLHPTAFVTSKEIQKAPLLGQICELAGCVFVDRLNRQKLYEEIGEIERVLREDTDVTIFPEATSTDGTSVLKFRRPLFLAAQRAERAIVPVCINYLTINGAGVDAKNRDFICWYGDMDFLPHIWKLCGLQSVELQVEYLPHFFLPKDGHLDDAVHQAHAAVSGAFRSLAALIPQ